MPASQGDTGEEARQNLCEAVELFPVVASPSEVEEARGLRDGYCA